MKTIITNKIDVTINYNKFFDKFDIYERKNILHQKKGSKYSSDLSKYLMKVKPLNYIPIHQNIVFVLPKNREIEIDSDTKKISKVDFKQLSLDKQVNLIIFSILVEKFNKYLPITQVSYGKSSLFYLVEKKSNNLITLSFSFELDNDELYLIMRVVTFKKATKYDKSTKITTDGKILKYASLEDKEIYVKGNGYGKNTINFFVRESKDFFSKKHKIKYLYQFYNDLKDNKIIDIKFKSQQVECKKITYHYKIKKTKNELQFLIDLVPKINVVNKTDLNCEEFFNNGLKFQFSDDISDSLPNLVILYPKEYYKNQKDPYEEIKQLDKYSQVILTDTIIKALNEKRKAIKDDILMVIIKELALKQDIKNRKINSINKKIKIHKITKILKDKKAILTISKDKKIKFEIKNLDKTDLKTGEIILEDFEGNINYIKNTLLSPFVNIEYLDKYITKTSGSFFAKSSELYPVGESLLGFKYFIKNNQLFYCNGLASNPNSTISKNFPFRKLCIKEDFIDYKLLKDELLESVDIFLVKLKDYTVYPFYIKYLNLYLEIENLI